MVTKIPERENNSELGNLFNEQQTTKNTRNDYAKVIEETHREVASMLAKLDNVTEKDVESLINEYLTENYPEIGRNDRTYISKSIQNEITGLGPLEELINDSTVSEIMVNGPNQIYVERKGKLVLSDVKFQDEEHVRRIIDRIVTPLGRRIDDSNPMVDARLKDGSRVNAIIPPLALCGSTITIRKFSDTPLTIENLMKFGSLSPEMAGFLEAGVRGKLNILVSGGTGSGKTTLVNAIKDKLTRTASLHFDDYSFDGEVNDFYKWVSDGANYNVWDLSPLKADIEKIINSDRYDYLLLDYPFAYQNKMIKDYLDCCIFIDTPLDIALARKVLRDMKESSADDIRYEMDVYLKYARIAYVQMLQDILPISDYVIDGTKELKIIINEAMEIILKC